MTNDSPHTPPTKNRILAEKIVNEISLWSLNSSLSCDCEMNEQKDEVLLRVKDYQITDIEKIRLLFAGFIQKTMGSLYKTLSEVSNENREGERIFPFFLTEKEFVSFKNNQGSLFPPHIIEKLEELQPYLLTHLNGKITADKIPLLVLYKLSHTPYNELPLVLHTDASSILDNTVIHFHCENDAQLNTPPDILVDPDGFEVGEAVSIYRSKSQIKEFISSPSYPLKISIRLNEELQLPLDHFIEITHDYVHQVMEYLGSDRETDPL